MKYVYTSGTKTTTGYTGVRLFAIPQCAAHSETTILNASFAQKQVQEDLSNLVRKPTVLYYSTWRISQSMLQY